MLAEILTAVVIAAAPVPTMPVSDVATDMAEPVQVEQVQGECLGEFEITAYGYNEGYGENYQTASGATPEPYYTVAVDPDVIPLGTVLYIEGVGEVKAQDTGGAVKGRVIDLHVGYDDCEQWGRQTRTVYKK